MRTMSKLRAYRLSKGLSQEALARRLGVGKAAICRIERGSRRPSLPLIARIVRVTAGELSANDFLPKASR
jgi:transcriptional regulator with XRE-family HTH domain